MGAKKTFGQELDRHPNKPVCTQATGTEKEKTGVLSPSRQQLGEEGRGKPP